MIWPGTHRATRFTVRRPGGWAQRRLSMQGSSVRSCCIASYLWYASPIMEGLILCELVDQALEHGVVPLVISR